MKNAVTAVFTAGHLWFISIAVVLFSFALLWRVDRAVNNGMQHIYAAVDVTNKNVRMLADNIKTVNNNVRNLATALKNNPGTSDLVYEWEDLPPLHEK